jgi:hypothetical protein
VTSAGRPTNGFPLPNCRSAFVKLTVPPELLIKTGATEISEARFDALRAGAG